MNRRSIEIPFLRRVLAAVMLVAICSSPLFADVITLTSGEKLEGKILSESTTSVRIQTRFGTTDVERSRIAKIVRGQTPKEVFEERKAALKAGDVEARFELALFCKENKLPKEWKKLLEEVLELKPGHDGANRELGRIPYDGRWFTKEELEKYKTEETARMEAAGYVWHDGKWMKEDEAMTARGFVKVEDKWIPKEELERLQAVRDWERVYGTGLNVMTTEHFELRTPLPLEDFQEMMDIAEECYAKFVELAQPDELELKFIDPEKHTFSRIYVYVHESPTDVAKFIESGYVKRHYMPKETQENHRDAPNFAVYFPIPLIVLSEGRHLRASNSRDVSQTGMLLVHLGQVLVRRLKRGGGLPAFAECGMGHWAEGEFNGFSTLSIIEYPHFEPFVDKWSPEGWETIPRWRENLANPGAVAKLPSLASMLEKPVEALQIHEEAKAWSLVCFLLETRRQQFFDFVRAAKTKFRAELITNSQAFKDAFAPETVDQVDAAWREWVKTQPVSGPTPKKAAAPLGGGGASE